MKDSPILLPARLRWLLVAGAWGGYFLAFFALQTLVGPAAVSFSILPVVVISWYFGIVWSLPAFLSAVILNAILLLTQYDYPFVAAFLSQNVIVGNVIVLFVALVVGQLSTQSRRYKQEIWRRKNLEREQEVFANFLALLNDIVSAALATDNLQTMLQILAKRVNELLGTDSSYICLWDDERELTIPAEAHGPNRDAFLELRFAPGEKTLTAFALKAQSALAIEDVAHSNYCNADKAKDLYRGSMLCLPLIATGRKLGSLVLGFDDPHHFNQDKIVRGEMAARYISLALDKSLSLENAERNLKELALINRIFVAISSSLNLQESLQLIADEILSALSALHVGFALINGDQTGLVLTADAPASPDSNGDLGLVIPINGNPATEKILAEHKPLFIKDAQHDPLTAPIHELMALRGTQSLHLLPLFAGEKVIGTVGIDYPEANRDLNKDERRLIQTVLLQASTVIKTSHLFQQTQRNNKDLTALFQLSTELAATLDEKSIAQLVVDSLSHALGYDYLGFYLVDPKNGDRVLQTSIGWPENPEIVRIPPGRGITERPIVDGQLHYTPDVTKEPLYLVGVGSGSEVDVPIWIDDKVGGVLAAEKKEPHAFDQGDFDILAATANLAGLALMRGKLFSAERKQFEELVVLHAIALAVTESTNEEQLIQRATQIIGENLYPDNFGILMLDESIGALRVHPSYNIRKEILREVATVPLGQGVVGHVAETGLPEKLADVTLCPYYLNVDSKIQSELAVPLRIGKRTIGVINAESTKLAAFSNADERLLITLAGQLATAIDRLRTTAIEHERTTQLARSNTLIEALGQVAARIGSVPDINDVLQTLGDELKKMNLNCLVALRDSDDPSLELRYTSLPERFVHLFERVSGFKIKENRIHLEKLSKHIEITGKPRPAILNDPLSIVADILDQFQFAKIARILRFVGAPADMQIGHFPLLIDGDLQGFLWLWGESLQKEDLPAMSIFAKQVAIAIENARLLGEVRRLASIDELTGLHNRRHFYAIAQNEFNRGLRYGRSLSAMMLDIDRFKDFNDKYGHAIGDKVLQVVAQSCKQLLRKTDVLGRYGGEEFVILLPETKLEVARTVAERLRKSISETPIPTEKGDLTVTVSIGVAENNEYTPNLETLIARADQAMYVAKHKGRNQVATSI
jgi:diguanylate cyclase (GGDEF)-like protein